MSLLSFRETNDDGVISIYKIETKYNYSSLFSELDKYLFDCNGYTVNKRKSAVFTLQKNKVDKPLSDDWLLVPPRYVYQEFNQILKELRNEILKLNIVPETENLVDAFVNLYDDGDFIAFHKDHHDEENVIPIACILSFEKYEDEIHVMQFYRTIGDKYAPTKKERGINKEEFDVVLPNSSLAVMVGMQKKHVHCVKPGKKRISVVFTTR
jgi:hypothetical protein